MYYTSHLLVITLPMRPEHVRATQNKISQFTGKYFPFPIQKSSLYNPQFFNTSFDSYNSIGYYKTSPDSLCVLYNMVHQNTLTLELSMNLMDSVSHPFTKPVWRSRSATRPVMTLVR